MRKENLPVTCTLSNVMDYEPPETFDLVICLGNNLSFFDWKELEKLFSMIGSHTRPGGLFITNSWTIAEIVFKNFTPKIWSTANDLRYLVDNKMLFNPTRVESEMTILPANGAEEKRKAIDYIYSLNELRMLLKHSGFSMKETWSIPGKRKFALGEPRVYIEAEKL